MSAIFLTLKTINNLLRNINEMRVLKLLFPEAQKFRVRPHSLTDMLQPHQHAALTSASRTELDS